MDIKPQIIEKNGKKEFVILPYEEFLKIQEQLEDYDDLYALREAKQKEGDTPAISLKHAKNELNLE